MSKENTQLQKAEGSYSQRFTSMVVREFGSQVGTLELSPYQQVLAKHLFIGIDKALTDQEAKRVKDGRDTMPLVWSNVNMQKLAIDAVHRIELGLDALIPNHIHMVPYWNKKLNKYDLDLAIGYVGKDYYKREMAVEKPVNIIYELVHETDTFKPLMKSATNEIESYEFAVNNAFQRGPVIGGFGYIMHEDPTKNKLVLVSKDSMNKSKGLAKTNTFWSAYEENMQMVVVVRRVTAELKVDPKKVNASYMAVEYDDNRAEIERSANQDVIDIEAETGESEQEEQEAAAPAKEAQQPEQPEQPQPAKLDKKQATQNRKASPYVACPIKHRPTHIQVCETNKCGKFPTCDKAQEKIAELMAEDAEETTEQQAAAAGPDF